MNAGLEEFESALLAAVRDAQQLAEHNSEGVVRTEQLLAALLRPAEAPVNPAVAADLGLEQEKHFSLLQHRPSCACERCATATIALPAPDSAGSRLAAAMPFT
jgi:hypothetical protein